LMLLIGIKCRKISKIMMWILLYHKNIKRGRVLWVFAQH
jgi:hypothetical protein